MNTPVILNRSAIDSLPKAERTNLVNSLTGFKSANLVGTANIEGKTNLAIMSSAFHVGANPPLIGLLIRPHSVPRHTLENILSNGHYTINSVTEKIYKQAHQSSARYPQDESEFSATGLTAEYSEQCKAPYVAECPIQIGLSLVEHQTLAVNNTVLIVGEVIQIRMTSDLRHPDGHLDLSAGKIVSISGLDEYHLTNSLGRQAYAKVARV